MNELGDGPIEPEMEVLMNALAGAIDQTLNGKVGERAADARHNGFILLAFETGTDVGRCNYIANVKREDVVALLKHQLARFEGMPDVTGHA